MKLQLNACSSVALLLAAALSLLTIGCATYPLPAELLTSGGETPAFFSDEGSLQQIEETQEIAALQRQDYKVGPDDVLDVSVFEWEAVDQTKTLQLRVSETGVISLPSVGDVKVGGLSVQAIQRTIETALVERGVLQTPRVGVWVSEFRSRQISVIGDVNQPGTYAIHQNVTTLLEILSLSGGPRDSAGGLAYILRKSFSGKPQPRIRVDLDELLQSGDLSHNPVLSAGDVVYIPKAPHIYVYGAVKQAGAFTFRKKLRVLEAVVLAGGTTSYANKSAVRLTRKLENGTEKMYRLDLARIEAGRMPNIFLRDGDVLNIETSAPKVFFDGLLQTIRGLFTFSYRLDK